VHLGGDTMRASALTFRGVGKGGEGGTKKKTLLNSYLLASLPFRPTTEGRILREHNKKTRKGVRGGGARGGVAVGLMREASLSKGKHLPPVPR